LSKNYPAGRWTGARAKTTNKGGGPLGSAQDCRPGSADTERGGKASANSMSTGAESATKTEAPVQWRTPRYAGAKRGNGGRMGTVSVGQKKNKKVKEGYKGP